MQESNQRDSTIENEIGAAGNVRDVKKVPTVGDLMRSKTVACREDTSAIEVAQIMIVHRIRYCFVLNSHDELIGVIAAKSLQSAAGPQMESAIARDLMLPAVITTSRETTLSQAAAEMYRNKVQHLVVVSGNPNQLVSGIIGATDILEHMATR